MWHYASSGMIIFLLSSCSAAYTQQQCSRACTHVQRFRQLWLRRQCDACIKNPPIGFSLCSEAFSQPNNPNFDVIAEECVKSMPLTDQMCIKACKNRIFSKFAEMCSKCIRIPPITGDMCIYACDHTAATELNLQKVCYKCSVNPPASVKLCRYACQVKGNNYYRGICSSAACNWNQ